MQIPNYRTQNPENPKSSTSNAPPIRSFGTLGGYLAHQEALPPSVRTGSWTGPPRGEKGSKGSNQPQTSSPTGGLHSTPLQNAGAPYFRCVQGYLARKKHPPPWGLGWPQVSRHRATVGSYRRGGSHARGTHAAKMGTNLEYLEGRDSLKVATQGPTCTGVPRS